MSPRARVNDTFSAIQADNQRLQRQNSDLQAANNAYLERARLAENRARSLTVWLDEASFQLLRAEIKNASLRIQLSVARDRSGPREFHAEL